MTAETRLIEAEAFLRSALATLAMARAAYLTKMTESHGRAFAGQVIATLICALFAIAAIVTALKSASLVPSLPLICWP